MNHAHNYPAGQHTLCTSYHTTTFFSNWQQRVIVVNFVAVLAVKFLVEASITIVGHVVTIVSTSDVLLVG